MDFYEWRAKHQGTLFVIVDGGADSTLIQRFYELGSGEACPLFAGTPFAEQSALGPWLLQEPSAEFVTLYPTLSGFYLISDQPAEEVRRHWRSLIEVIHEGEAVWFRFSDHRIFLPMLTTMTLDELDAVLGPCAGLWANNDGFSRTQGAEFHPPRQTPWFHIRPHHLTALYDESRHAYILRRRLWQAMTAMMERHPNPEDVILPLLKRANQAGLQDDIRDGVVAGALTLQVGLPLDSIQVPLVLTEDELAQIENWLNKHNDLTGAR
ncbi:MULTISPECIES: DUF4123 domain-containing protein [Aeromonas]|uniref:DUF4123 domain-containing protein n=1 Tax=Aeromonas TaxID=642 RepID=UPI00051B9A50|nr:MULTISPECIES: DUF4123 domain-containing protein [Aeromonas]MCH7370459.1 DUF4123 domain-containing protein [Aeromonas sp. MR16]